MAEPIANKRFEYSGLFVVLVVAALVGYQTLHFDFVTIFDDILVYKNPLVIGNASSPLWSWEELFWTPGAGYPKIVAYGLWKSIYFLVGLQPTYFHALNLSFHLLNMIFFYLLATQLGLRPLSALGGVIFFGIHPVASGTYAWISSLPEILASFFALATLREVFTRPRRNFGLLLFFFGLLSGPSILVLPLVLCQWEKTEFSSNWTSIFKKYWTWFMLALLTLSVLLFFEESLPWILNHFSKFLHEGWYMFSYQLGLLFSLVNSLPIYPLRPKTFSWSVEMIPILLITLFFILRLGFRDTKRLKIYDLGILLLFASLILAGWIFSRASWIGDRFSYFPLLGLSLSLAAVIELVFERIQIPTLRTATYAFVIMMILGLIPLALLRAVPWRNSISLWQTVEAAVPGRPEICRGLGDAFWRYRQYEKAQAQFEKCQQEFPESDFAKFVVLSIFAQGKWMEAIEAAEELLKVDPTLKEDPQLKPVFEMMQKH